MNTKTFFSELQRLIDNFPQTTPDIFNSEDCDYTDKIYYCKNLSFSFDDANCEESSFLYDSYLSNNCLDCDYSVESELCYECVDVFRCFNGNYLENCSKVRDSWYSYNCVNCANVFGCANLQNKSFCIFNRQFSEEEYKERLSKYASLPADKILKILSDLKGTYPLTQTIEGNNENSSYGNYVFYDKNCYLCFDAAHDENCAYLYDSFYNKFCLDMTYGSQNNELSYEIVDSSRMFNCNFAVRSNNCSDCSYIFNCSNIKDCLGCVSLSNSQYCILNRQVTKDQYETLKAQIFYDINEEKIGWDRLNLMVR